MTWLFTSLFGNSLLVLRLIPALAGCGAIALTGYQASQFGGRRFAMGLAALLLGISAVFVINGHLLGTNDFEALFWMGGVSVVIRIVQTGNQKLWLWFGVLAGIGLLNKYSITVFGMGIVVGLLFTPERKAFAHKWIWLAGALALLIFLPNLLWNIHRDWPFVQLMHNIRAEGRDVALNPLDFFIQQVLMVNPFAFPLWLAGLYWLFFGREGRRYRVLGWAWVVTLAVFTSCTVRITTCSGISHAFAAGGVVCEQWIERTRRGWLKPALCGVAGAVFALLPIMAPVISPEKFVAFRGPYTSPRPSASTTMPVLRCRSTIPTNSAGKPWWLRWLPSITACRRMCRRKPRSRPATTARPPPSTISAQIRTAPSGVLSTRTTGTGAFMAIPVRASSFLAKDVLST